MCTARNASASNETLRCTASNTNLGTVSVCTRRTFAIPSARLTVSSTSVTVPGAPRQIPQRARSGRAAHLRILRRPPEPALLGRATEPAPAPAGLTRRRSRAACPRRVTAEGDRRRLELDDAVPRGGVPVECVRGQQREQSGCRHGAGDQPAIDPADQLQTGLACDDRARRRLAARRPGILVRDGGPVHRTRFFATRRSDR